MATLQASNATVSLQGQNSAGAKQTSTALSRSSLFGTKLPVSLLECPTFPKPSSLVCNAVVWWSDATKELIPDWQKAHLRRVEALEALERDYEAGKEPSVELPTLIEEVFAIGKDALVGGGIAQEMIIGRTAMLGFFAAMTVEIESGCTVWQQLSVRGGAALIMVSLAVIAGSLAPKVNELLKREFEMPVKPFRGFTANAERLNGQAAMVGFVALLATEYVKGTAVF
jgi:hypothetical protein